MADHENAEHGFPRPDASGEREPLKIRQRAVLGVAGFVLAPLAAIACSIAAAPWPAWLYGAGLACLMFAIAVIDSRTFRIPDELTLAAALLGILRLLTPPSDFEKDAIAMAALRATVAGGLFLALMFGYEWLRHRRGLGLGDVKLAAVAGVWLDWISIAAVVEIAALTALVVYASRAKLADQPFSGTIALPFGLYLAPAIWVGWLGETLLPYV